jgi:hypothetical protein
VIVIDKYNMSNYPRPNFINPLCSIQAVSSDAPMRQEYYNCILKENTIDIWTCFGPYNNTENANKLNGICNGEKLLKGRHSILIPVDKYLPANIDIKRQLLKVSYPIVTVIDYLHEDKDK